jgi:hypothetical protein
MPSVLERVCFKCKMSILSPKPARLGEKPVISEVSELRDQAITLCWGTHHIAIISLLICTVCTAGPKRVHSREARVGGQGRVPARAVRHPPRDGGWAEEGPDRHPQDKRGGPERVRGEPEVRA